MDKIVLLTLMLFVAVFCRASYIPRFQKNEIDSAMENRIYQKVSSLAEVIKYSNYIDSISNGKKVVTMLTRAIPNYKRKYFWIQVGFSDSFRFNSKYNFYVYPDGMVVKLYDPLNDKIMNIKEWRKQHNLITR